MYAIIIPESPALGRVVAMSANAHTLQESVRRAPTPFLVVNTDQPLVLGATVRLYSLEVVSDVA